MEADQSSRASSSLAQVWGKGVGGRWSNARVTEREGGNVDDAKTEQSDIETGLMKWRSGPFGRKLLAERAAGLGPFLPVAFMHGRPSCAAMLRFLGALWSKVQYQSYISGGRHHVSSTWEQGFASSLFARTVRSTSLCLESGTTARQLRLGGCNFSQTERTKPEQTLWRVFGKTHGASRFKKKIIEKQYK